MSATMLSELHDDFPHDADALRALKLRDAHFCNLAGRYHALGRALYRIDAEIEPVSENHRQWLKAKRLQLLDEIALTLEQAEARLGPATAAM